mmetsp:Transcript_14661/g.39247  ORF Transcript_14661/g.39247 Transcript_14661/m.39247 type:complete len:251 (-) Transcript_14661:135-887(-)
MDSEDATSESWSKSLIEDVEAATDVVRTWTRAQGWDDASSRHLTFNQGVLHDSSMAPQEFFAECVGIAFIWEYKLGFLVGAQGGRGMVFARLKAGTSDQRWSAPSSFTVFGGTFGLLAGATRSCLMVFLFSEAELKKFYGASINFGTDLNISAGLVGRDARTELAAGHGGLSSSVAYSFAQGAFAGSALTAGMGVTNSAFLRSLYGPEATAEAVLTGTLGLEKVDREPAFIDLYSWLAIAVRDPEADANL